MKQWLVVVALALLTAPAPAGEQPQPPRLQAHALAKDVYWVEGGVANTGFVIGPDGVVVIDAQRSRAEGIAQLALIANTTSKAVAAIIVTHADPDHVGGLTAYLDHAKIIMQENARTQIQAAAAKTHEGGPFFGPLYQNIARDRLLDHTVAAYEDINLAGIPMELLHPAPAHSSGDLVAYFPEQKVVFGGDIVLSNQGRFPIIHIGGSSLGWIAAIKTILALNADVIVPGHGPIISRGELEQRLQDAEERRAAIKKMVEAGNTLAEIDAALPPDHANQMFPSFNQTTYDELTKGYPTQVPPWESLMKPPSPDPAR